MEKKNSYTVVWSYKGLERRIVVKAETRADAEDIVYEKNKHLFDHDAIHGTENCEIKSVRRH
jgi:hypothetical protein